MLRESLEGTDLVRFGALMNQLFRNGEELYYLQLEGHLDPRVWRGWEAVIRDFSGHPGIQAFWRSRSHWFSEDFAKFVNQVQQTAKPPRVFREPNADQ